jgi:LysM domain
LKISTAAGTAIRRDDERVTLPSYRELQMSGVRRWGHLLRNCVRRRRPERRLLGRLAAVLALAGTMGALGGCGYDAVVHSWFDRSGGPEPPSSQKLPGHVYLLRGLIGDVYSLGVDQLADKINHRGLTTTVDAYTAYNTFADEIISKYKSGEERGPVLLAGHSLGGDSVITIAEKLKAAGIAVPVAFSLDPSRLSGNVPSNVELFINIYQSFNPIGGGEVSAAADFRGRLINVDLRQHNEVVHINLDKTAAIQDIVADKIAAVAADWARNAMGAPSRRVVRGPDVRPLNLKYVVPRDAQIVLWDSAIEITARPGDTPESLAAANGVPVWALAQINKIDQDRPIEPGRRLLVPRNQYADATLPAPPPPVSVRGPPVARNSQRLPPPPAAAPGATTASSAQSANSFTDRFRVESAH